jgi:hypothetical protein
MVMRFLQARRACETRAMRGRAHDHHRFCHGVVLRVDEQIRAIPKHPEAHLWPSEVVTLGLLHALKGVDCENMIFFHQINWLRVFRSAGASGMVLSQSCFFESLGVCKSLNS